MNAHALQVLEFDTALQAVASRCAGELGRAAVLALRPGSDLPALRAELRRVWEGLEVHRRTPEWAPPAPPDARRPLKVLEREGGVLAAPELLLVLRLLEASGTLARELPDLLESRDPTASTLVDILDALVVDAGEEDRLRGLVGDDGVLRDGASPLLRQLRRKVQAARSRIVRRLESYAGSLPERVRVPDASVSVRDGRYVIQIRREGKTEVGGVIHGESSTGATLFVEPPLALQLMSEILELERAEDREVQRILREVSSRLRSRHGALHDALLALVAFDSLWARVLTAHRWKAQLPELVAPDNEAGMRVVQGRHPLLLEQADDERQVVPFSLELDAEERALVISGPNTGGKTVFLKAMGLFPLLAQSGILPPVGPGTRLPVVWDVFADIGDEQSIAESLSTFSAHLANARQILEGAGPGALVLMDEMGTGTDPAEGAALAQALLETLVERGARAFVTSHLGAMKRLDTPGSGIVNGSLLFDPDRIEPTYRFQKGRPGRSYGLAIARRLGFPAHVLDRAEGYVSSGELEVESLLASLEQKESALADALEAGQAAREEAERLRGENARRARELERREKGAEEKAREAARQYLLEAREEVEAAIRELREADAQARDEMEREARKRVEDAARSQARAAARTRTGPRHLRQRGGSGGRGDRDGSASSSLGPGDRVRLRGSGSRGTVRTREGDRLSVEVGSLRFDLHEDEVEGLSPAGGKGGDTGRRGSRDEGAVATKGTVRVPEIEARPEVQLLGLRVDEVELVLGRALDGAVLAHLPHLRIVHGKGTGALRARVHELLRQDRRVVEFRRGVHGEGGAGVTVAVLQ